MKLTTPIARLKRAMRAYGRTQKRFVPRSGAVGFIGSLRSDFEYFVKHTCGYVGGGDLFPRWENQEDHGGH